LENFERALPHQIDQDLQAAPTVGHHIQTAVGLAWSVIVLGPGAEALKLIVESCATSDPCRKVVSPMFALSFNVDAVYVEDIVMIVSRWLPRTCALAVKSA